MLINIQLSNPRMEFFIFADVTQPIPATTVLMFLLINNLYLGLIQNVNSMQTNTTSEIYSPEFLDQC